MKPKTIDYEQSEVLLYQNMLYKEAGLFDQSVKHLEDNDKYIVDKLNLLETKADSYLKLKKLDEAVKIYENLLERNPDNVIYYRKLEECLNLSKKKQTFIIEKMSGEKRALEEDEASTSRGETKKLKTQERNEPIRGFSQCPHEILLMIFKYLNIREVCQMAR